MLVDALHDFLAGDPGMISFLGTKSTRADSTDGCFPVQAYEQPTMPYVVFAQISGVSLEVVMEGTGPLTQERWRISCYGTTSRNAKILAKNARVLLLGWLGLQATGDLIQGSIVESEMDTTEPLARGTLFGCHVDFMFTYTDAADYIPA